MAGGGVGRIFGGASGVVLQNSRLSSSSEPFFISGSSSSSPFLGSGSMVSFKDVCGGKRSERPFFCTYDLEENGDEDFDEYLHQPEKKRRLTVDQVQFLEKSFEVENKLEPERKIQLAKDLGLQPRQVAIWFQNRRARWKTKQLEKDYDALQANYNNLKGDYEKLLKEKEKLKAEVVQLTDKLQMKEELGNISEQSDLCGQLKTAQQEPNVESASESEDQHGLLGYNKQEDLNSAKSDIIDSDSSAHYVDAVHSCYAFEADQSDISQDDEDYLNRSLLPSSHVVPNIEDVDPPANNSSHFGLHGNDHESLLWPYWHINLKMPTSMHM